MKLRLAYCVACVLWACLLASPVGAIEPLKPIARKLPPPGIEVPNDQLQPIREELARLEQRLAAMPPHGLAPDVEVYLKAVSLALKFNEFYKPQDVAKATGALRRAAERLDQLEAGKTPWTTERGLVVRGYRSAIDDSVQPYGLVIPDEIDVSQPVPLYVWLHGRGDKSTDLHFITVREASRGTIAPDGAIVLHPFGRHCIGFKAAGEIDVLDAIEHVASQYAIDRDRVVLMGFSMGGAGAWHVGAHYADHFAAISPGAGFVETACYNNLAPADYPPAYEQTLWGLYDVPGYVRNLFNVPIIAYSGEIDRQRQAAQVMEEAFAAQGHTLPHLIGPGMGHKYHPDTLRELMTRMATAAKQGRPQAPPNVFLQTRTLRYNRMFSVEVLGLEHHWRDSRVDVKATGPDAWSIATKNITRLRLHDVEGKPGAAVAIDGQMLRVPQRSAGGPPVLVRRGAAWTWTQLAEAEQPLAKRPGLQGPIDDAFMAPFLVVTPGGNSPHPLVERWVQFELAHLVDRWQALFRGRLRMKKDSEVTEADLRAYNLVLWGDAGSNAVIRRTLAALPLSWNEKELRIAGKTYDAAGHVPVMIYPNPLQPDKYIVLNSGPTFREGHDRTNSLQNPKLPDWAVVDLGEPPSDTAPGKIVAADFFDEAWQIQPASGGAARDASGN